jgi:hypothetical protein
MLGVDLSPRDTGGSSIYEPRRALLVYCARRVVGDVATDVGVCGRAWFGVDDRAWSVLKGKAATEGRARGQHLRAAGASIIAVRGRPSIASSVEES